MAALEAKYQKEIKQAITPEMKEMNVLLAKEVYLSVGRYKYSKRVKSIRALMKTLKKAMTMGVDFNNEELRSDVFDDVVLHVRYLHETPEQLHGTCVLNLAEIKYADD